MVVDTKNRILLLFQSISNNYLAFYHAILKNYGELVILTGSKVEENDSLKVVHTPQHDPKGILSRLKSWIGYVISAYKYLRKDTDPFDLTFASTNPPIAPFIAYYLKKHRKIPYVLLVWDIYPDVIENTKAFKWAGFIFGLWRHMNEKVYHNAEKVITIGEVMSQTLKQQCKNKNFSIEVIPIWVDENKLNIKKESSNSFREKHNLHNKFIALYSGKMGYGHDIESILKAAERLRNEKDIIFIFSGSGPKYEMLKKKPEVNKAENIILLDWQPFDEFLSTLSGSNVAFVSQDKGMGHFFMPSKTYDMMAAGLPIIAINEGENDLNKTIRDFKIGINVAPGDIDGICNGIFSIKNDSEFSRHCSENGVQIVQKYFSPQVIKQMYVGLFSQIFKNIKQVDILR